MSRPALLLNDLTVAYGDPGVDAKPVVQGVSLEIRSGEVLGLVGESGCGKSTTALSMLGYRGTARVVSGSSMLDGRDLLKLPLASIRRIWGKEVAFVPQGAASALCPSLRIGRQLREPLQLHLGLDRDSATQHIVELLEAVGLDGSREWLRRYPHELSGGQQQRVVLALAIACNPSVLVLDEPTTGLDPTTQATAAGVLKKLVAETDLSAVYVTHDIGLLRDLATSVAVMYAGQVVEQGAVSEVLDNPTHPYTRALIAALPTLARRQLPRSIRGNPPPAAITDSCAFAPRCDFAQPSCEQGQVPLLDLAGRLVRCIRATEVLVGTSPPNGAAHRSAGRGSELITVSRLHCDYRSAPGHVDAVADVSLRLMEGEALAVVGESGSGKSTLLRAIAGLHRPRSGTIRYRGQTLAADVSKRPRHVCRDLQLVFQNPDRALNPRKTVRQEIARPLHLFRETLGIESVEAEIERLVELVRLPTAVLDRFPSQLSGGQCQRVALARAFAARPTVLLCDEVTSALDVSVQASILETLQTLSHEYRTSLLFVSHDFAVVRAVSDRVVVMKAGAIRESAEADSLFSAPSDEYTRELLQATSFVA